MPFGMGLNKNRHGTFEARKKVPRHLEEAVARVLGYHLEAIILRRVEGGEHRLVNDVGDRAGVAGGLAGWQVDAGERHEDFLS